MNILVFCHEFPPVGAGAGNALKHLSFDWQKSGHQVTVVTAHCEGLPDEERAGGVRIVRLRISRKSRVRATIGDHMRFAWASLTHAVKLYRSSQPSIVVSFMTIPAGFAGWYLKKRFRVPLAVELRGGDVPGFAIKAIRLYHNLVTPIVRSIWNDSDVVIANGSGLIQSAQKTVPSLAISMIPNGVDSGYFVPAEKPIVREVPRALFVGRFDEDQKNISMMIRAVAGLEGWRLRMVGDGEHRERFVQLARSMGIEGRIEWKGWLKNDMLLKEYQEADFYLSTSRAEGMPNSVLEAMSVGKPVVLTNIPGHTELVTSGESGFLFNLDDDQALRESLKKILLDPELRRSMGAAARKRAVERHNPKQLAQRHLECFERCLKKV